MSLGKGSLYFKPLIQKINMRSSTEAEIVVVDDIMSMVLWIKYLAEETLCSFEIYILVEPKIYDPRK